MVLIVVDAADDGGEGDSSTAPPPTIQLPVCICGKAWCTQTTTLLKTEKPEAAHFLSLGQPASPAPASAPAPIIGNGGDEGTNSSSTTTPSSDGTLDKFRELCWEYFHPEDRDAATGTGTGTHVAQHHFHPALREIWAASINTNNDGSDMTQQQEQEQLLAFSEEIAVECDFDAEANRMHATGMYIVTPNYPRVQLYREMQVFQDKQRHQKKTRGTPPASAGTDDDTSVTTDTNAMELRDLCIEIALEDTADEYYNTISSILFQSTTDSRLNEQALKDICFQKSGSITDDASNPDRDLRFQVVFDPATTTFRTIETLAAQVGIINPNKSMIGKAVLLVGGTQPQPLHADIYVLQSDNHHPDDDSINQQLHSPDSYCSTILSVQRDTDMSIGVQLDQVHFVGPNVLTIQGDPLSELDYNPTTFDGVRIGVESPHGFQFRGDFFHSGMPSQLVTDANAMVREKLLQIQDTEESMVPGLKQVMAEHPIGHLSRLFLFIEPKEEHRKLKLSADHIAYGWEEP